MTNSVRIAGLLGPTLIAVAVTEALNLRAMTAVAASSVVHVVYLNGTLLFVAGLAIVRAHNLWVRGWPILVTLIGWLLMVAGLARMAAPEAAQESVGDTAALYPLLAVILAIGAFLSFKAYARAES
jgi:uncharacterized membrane protein YhaH (DUF805 family)